MLILLANGKLAHLSKVEAARLARYKLRTENIDDYKGTTHAPITGPSRRTMRNLVRWRNKKSTGRYGGKVAT